jgi:hypothetical protein
MTVYASVNGTRSFDVSINGGSAVNISMTGNDFGTPFAVTKNVTLKAGDNILKFYNSSAGTPDLDRIKITGTAACVPESNTEFCARQAKTCGSLTGSDNCGASRTVSSCGSCASGQTCGGGGVANVCGGGGSGSCATPYNQDICLNYAIGVVVANEGRNWTCVSSNCRNCATYTGCAPGGTTCPFGVVWTDNGTCTGSGGASGGGTCAAAFAKPSCTVYSAGTTVSRNGRNWTCANANCVNCATYATCEPGNTGCPWGTVWTDSGTCN